MEIVSFRWEGRKGVKETFVRLFNSFFGVQSMCSEAIKIAMTIVEKNT